MEIRTQQSNVGVGSKTLQLYFRRYLFLGLALLFTLGCSQVQDVILSEPPSETDSMPIRVTLLYPDACPGSDYCDTIQRGAKQAEAELGIELTEAFGDQTDPALLERQLRDAAQNSDLVITAGYQMEAILAKVAPEFPDINFAIIDVALELPNVAAINHKLNEASFLVGAIAALKTETNKIGYIGGADVPLLHEFEAGYVAGAKVVKPDVTLSIEYISTNVDGFLNPERAKEFALAQYENGIDVIFAVAGGSGAGILDAAKMQQKYIIWVDANGNHLAPGLVLTSMVRHLDSLVYELISETIDGNFRAGTRYLGIAEGGVDYVVDEHNASLLSEETLKTVEALRTGIIAGEIVVPNQVSLPR